MELTDFFRIAMDRHVMPLIDPQGPMLNLGIGRKDLGMANITHIGLPDWDAETDPIPYVDGTFAQVWALHFLEHIDNVLGVLRECHRVLRPHGVLNVCVPYGACHMYVHDLTHRHMFNEDTWRQTFNNAYYDDKGTDWNWSVGTNVIMAVKGENLALLTQLIKGA